MDLITGGFYQGKLDHAKEKYQLSEEEIETCREDTKPDLSKRCLNCYEQYVLYCLKNGLEDYKEVQNAEIIIMNDIFCGVVSMDKEQRLWREECGRTLVMLAKKAENAERIFCGLSTKLK